MRRVPWGAGSSGTNLTTDTTPVWGVVDMRASRRAGTALLVQHFGLFPLQLALRSSQRLGSAPPPSCGETSERVHSTLESSLGGQYIVVHASATVAGCGRSRNLAVGRRADGCAMDGCPQADRRGLLRWPAALRPGRRAAAAGGRQSNKKRGSRRNTIARTNGPSERPRSRGGRGCLRGQSNAGCGCYCSGPHRERRSALT